MQSAACFGGVIAVTRHIPSRKACRNEICRLKIRNIVPVRRREHHSKVQNIKLPRLSVPIVTRSSAEQGTPLTFEVLPLIRPRTGAAYLSGRRRGLLQLRDRALKRDPFEGISLTIAPAGASLDSPRRAVFQSASALSSAAPAALIKKSVFVLQP